MHASLELFLPTSPETGRTILRNPTTKVDRPFILDLINVRVFVFVFFWTRISVFNFFTLLALQTHTKWEIQTDYELIIKKEWALF